jgi:hypothetical protein
LNARGLTLVELLISTSLLGGFLLFATAVTDSIGRTGNRGRRALEVRTANEKAVEFVVNELQNASSGLDPDTGTARFRLENDTPAVELVSRTAASARTGRRDESRVSDAADEVLAGRPRLLRVARNSRFTFRRVTGVETDPVTGDAHARWSDPITYYVEARRLIREQAGRRRVIGTNVSAFKVIAHEEGNFTVILRSQLRDPSTGEVLSASNSVEIRPRN